MFPERESDLVRRRLCPVCSGKHRPDTVVDGMTYVRCVSCRLTFMEPMPSQAWYDTLYVSDYWTGRAKAHETDDEIARRLRKEHLRAITYLRAIERAGPLPARGVILEIGCGSGGAVATIADRLGWDAVGVEPDHPSRSLATGIGVTIEPGGVEQLAADGRVFDVVLLSHVLEHVVEPTDFIGRVTAVLSEHGLILIEVPNALTNESLHLFHPYLFTRRALTTLLANHGLSANVVAHGGATSRMRAHYLLATVRRSRRAKVTGLRGGRAMGRTWSRAWKRGRALRRVDQALVQRYVTADEALLARWQAQLATGR